MKKRNTFYKTFHLEIVPDDFTQRFFIDNFDYRDWLYNKAVELTIDLYNQNRKDRELYYFKKYEISKILKNQYELIYTKDRPDNFKHYKYYFTGISECVVDDLSTNIRKINTNLLNGDKAELHTIYRRNKRSFRFKNKLTKTTSGRLSGNRIKYDLNDPFKVGLSINAKYAEPIYFKIRENMCTNMKKFNWDLNDVVEISISFDSCKWHLDLILNYTNQKENVMNRLSKIMDRKPVVGIDLGETNPVVIYDGDCVVSLPENLRFPKEAVCKIGKHIDILNAVLDRKYKPELKDAGKRQSNNYYKILDKVHKYYKKAYNIKKDWHFKLAYWIVTNFDNVVVDEFSNHIVKKSSDYPTDKRNRVNRSMQNKSMSLFIQRFRFMSEKYGVNYFTPRFETTNTCSDCGNINTKKLRIDKDVRENIFVCEKCGMKKDRDQNAAKNCYLAFHRDLSMLKREF